MRSSLSSISCASWLVYATRATDDNAKRVMSAILKIKTDRVDAATGTPLVRIVIEARGPGMNSISILLTAWSPASHENRVAHRAFARRIRRRIHDGQKFPGDRRSVTTIPLSWPRTS